MELLRLPLLLLFTFMTCTAETLLFNTVYIILLFLALDDIWCPGSERFETVLSLLII
jgi:hypothetical protein